MTDQLEKWATIILIPLILLLCLASMIMLTWSVDDVSLLVPMSIGDALVAASVIVVIHEARNLSDD